MYFFLQAAMAAYLKDVESNTRDMTAENIIKEKFNRRETGEVSVSRLFAKLKILQYILHTLELTILN